MAPSCKKKDRLRHTVNRAVSPQPVLFFYRDAGARLAVLLQKKHDQLCFLYIKNFVALVKGF